MGEAKQRKQLNPEGFRKVSATIDGKKLLVDHLKIESYFTDPDLIDWVENLLPDTCKKKLRIRVPNTLTGLGSAIVKGKDPKKLYAGWEPKISRVPYMGFRLSSGRLWVNPSYPGLPPDCNILESWVDLENHVPIWHKSIWD